MRSHYSTVKLIIIIYNIQKQTHSYELTKYVSDKRNKTKETMKKKNIIIFAMLWTEVVQPSIIHNIKWQKYKKCVHIPVTKKLSVMSHIDWMQLKANRIYAFITNTFCIEHQCKVIVIVN